MSEWWSYSLSDFQMYSAATFVRLLEAHNAHWFPLQALAAAFVLWLAWAVWKGGAKALLGATACLALCWLWIAATWFWDRLAAIDIAAPWFAYAFALQGLALFGFAARLGPERVAEDRFARLMAMQVVDLGGIVLPIVMVLAMGAGWGAMPVFGLFPDATALATLGLLLALRGGRWLAIIPLAWCLISGALQWNLGFQVAVLWPALAAAAAIFVLVRGADDRRRT